MSVDELGVGVTVGVGVGVYVADGVGVGVSDGVGVNDAVGVTVSVMPGVRFGVCDGVGDDVGDAVGDAVGVDVDAAVAVGLGVCVGEDVGDGVGVSDGVDVDVAVAVGLGVAVAFDVISTLPEVMEIGIGCTCTSSNLVLPKVRVETPTARGWKRMMARTPSPFTPGDGGDSVLKLKAPNATVPTTLSMLGPTGNAVRPLDFNQSVCVTAMTLSRSGSKMSLVW